MEVHVFVVGQKQQQQQTQFSTSWVQLNSKRLVGLRWIFVTEQHPLVEIYGTNLTLSALTDKFSVHIYH